MLKDYFECWDVPGNGHCGFSLVALALTGHISSQFLVHLLCYHSFLQTKGKKNWTNFWIEHSDKQVFDNLLRKGVCSTVGLEFWFSNFIAAQLVANTLKCPLSIMNENLKDGIYLFNMPFDISVAEWNQAWYLYMPNSSHFNLLIPRSNVEKFHSFQWVVVSFQRTLAVSRNTLKNTTLSLLESILFKVQLQVANSFLYNRFFSINFMI
jgi:hypothetical protein